jgi:dCMP deaminase
MMTTNMQNNMTKPPVIISYIPVLHEGYRRLLEHHPEASKLYIIPRELTPELTHLIKDIRALEPKLIKQSLEGWKLPYPVEILDRSVLKQLSLNQTPIIAPQEEITQHLIDTHLSKNPIVFDTIFLRWDAKQVTQQKAVVPDFVLNPQTAEEKLMAQAYSQAGKSADWWRQIGSLLVKDGEVLLAGYNHHVPSEQQHYVDGDPRGNFKKGLAFELSTALHAEAGLIAEAARRGLSTTGCDLYATTFPCPPCAKLVAYSGIKRLYYSEGYAVLDGESIMRSQGVEIIRVGE